MLIDKSAEKESKISGKATRVQSGKQDEMKKRLAAESAVKEAKAKAIAEKNTPPPVVEEVAAAPVDETPATETPAAEA